MIVFILLIIYLLIFFVIAILGERNKRKFSNYSSAIYSLSLAVYCTSWTFYGNIGLASSQNIQPITIYLGATLGLIIFAPLVAKMVQLKTYYHSTSLADFLSARYQNSRFLASMVSIICLLGIVPYLTIQVAPMINTFLVVTQLQPSSHLAKNLDVIVIIIMSLITIFAGVRKLDPTERHVGMMLALAMASLFKLAVFLIAGAIISYTLFDEIQLVMSGDLLQSQVFNEQLNFNVFSQPPEISNWFSMMVLGAVGIIILPRQFHVGVVECSDPRHVASARWQLSLYMLLINLFVIPVAIAGEWLLPNEPIKDMLLLLIPIELNMPALAAMVFLGGFAAASCMIIVCTMTLSTMVTNHLFVPLIEQNKKLHWLKSKLLNVRRASVFIILFIVLLYYRLMGDNYLLIELGSISFIAVLQFAPALFGGLLWRKANLEGAATGIIIGACIWFYTSMFPTFVRSGLIESNIIEQGLFGISWFIPESLFGITGLSPMANSLFWSLSFNITAFIFISSYYRADTPVSEQVSVFFDDFSSADIRGLYETQQDVPGSILILDKKQRAINIYSKYMSRHEANKKVEHCLKRVNLTEEKQINIAQLAELISCLTHVLAGVIGMASAHQEIRESGLVDPEERQTLSKYYANILSRHELSPTELLNKVNFYGEKQKLLEDHDRRQQGTIQLLEKENQSRKEAELALKDLNESLEYRVELRTSELKQSNNELKLALDEIKTIQHQLVEAEKMVSLTALVAGIAHEINTPAGIILTSTTMASEQVVAVNNMLERNELTKELLQSILEQLTQCHTIELESVNKIINLIQCFREVSADVRLESPSHFSLFNTVDTAVKSCPRDLSDSIIIRVDIDKSLVMFSYVQALTKVINILLNNSLEHGFSEKDSGEIIISATEKQSRILISYRDNGKGMEKNSIEKIFDPFFTSTRSKGSMGLGAHIAYNYVTTKLLGKIKAVPIETGGLEFTIDIPKNMDENNTV